MTTVKQVTAFVSEEEMTRIYEIAKRHEIGPTDWVRHQILAGLQADHDDRFRQALQEARAEAEETGETDPDKIREMALERMKVTDGTTNTEPQAAGPDDS